MRFVLQIKHLLILNQSLHQLPFLLIQEFSLVFSTIKLLQKKNHNKPHNAVNKKLTQPRLPEVQKLKHTKQNVLNHIDTENLKTQPQLLPLLYHLTPLLRQIPKIPTL